jgi:hypothetical protein
MFQAHVSQRFLTAAAFIAACTLATSAGAQIIDRPVAQPKAPMRWGVVAGFTPLWSTPTNWGRVFITNTDPERKGELRFEGSDFRIGVVRARPLGFEWGLSYVRKTVSDNLRLPKQNYNYYSGGSFTDANPVTYTGVERVEVSGFDSHVVVPAGRIGSRVQIGALLGGGFGLLPEEPVLKTVTGPPYYPGCQPTVTPVLVPPATGGCVADESGQFVPLISGTNRSEVTESLVDAWGQQNFWLFMRTQVAVDVMIAQPLKVRFAGGFNYPSAQYFGVDVVYLIGAR